MYYDGDGKYIPLPGFVILVIMSNWAEFVYYRILLSSSYKILWSSQLVIDNEIQSISNAQHNF